MGAGAAALAGDEELHAALQAAGWAPTVQRVAAADAGAPEIARTFDLLAQLADDVRATIARGAFPLVLGGACLTAAAAVAGSGAAGALGVVWLDAHADLDTPDDNVSGFLDVMALSVLTGGAWRTQGTRLRGFAPVAEERVALLGVRDLAPYQRARMQASRVRAVAGAFTGAQARAALATLPPVLYLHVDLDVLDTAVGHANRYAAPGGPSLAVVLDAVDAAFDHGRVVAATLSAYDPHADRDGAIRAAATAIAGRVARRAREQCSARPGGEGRRGRRPRGPDPRPGADPGA
jgi:arginase